MPPPPGGMMLGNPDEDWGFGDPMAESCSESLNNL